jgi:putative membrane protein insertion efficiency factor
MSGEPGARCAAPADQAASADGASAGSRLPARLVLVLLRGYKILVSPLFAGACRYTPSCSDYMAEAVRLHGAPRGVWFGLRRLARCHPFGGHGVDPVPGR